ncbi:hypothetical protein Kpol_1019p12 [Vanderwaltozyma polyspora DSM 70294]|uniref:V-type proton ATPase subunit C n=1 Tax=Vanderwaltozyma polyspora (strain ATCC 22028 / DSM 70294 / BCRC 21397 / CBS 2163 / NBRC 10782 / NRRL Y-8283 / UCD 57-17) TaxID=436907 RepID=A7TPA5_VANPO|nr:uncharacterized protein Kpol_1019p12 [Vanderwaltozyma polyspora DSM 70294]EDO15892.1 hypothetical protein Kpol_1019p12 [Vanderwaltozyma polyspora DSM 70294]
MTSLYSSDEFILLSLPLNAKPSTDSSIETDLWLKDSLVDGKCYVSDFNIPEFKIGSLDDLILDSEELSKNDEIIENSIKKVTEIISSFNEATKNSYKTISINNMAIPEYLNNFQWDNRKFKLDKSIKELNSLISNESTQLDNDVKATAANYNNAKTNLATAERRKTGDLSVRSLHDIVKPEDFILNSEYLTTVLIAVPKSLKSDFEKHYETLTEKIVPESASIISEDAEYILYNVHLFKKSVAKFNSAARERKYIPREFNYSEELIDNLKKEHDSAASLEHSLKIQLVRLAKTAYADLFINWFHIKALRVFVESVLRYGLPSHFNIKIIATPPKMLSKSKHELIENFQYLAGNAFAKDKKGKINRQDNSLNQYSTLVDNDYEPFVIYTVSL